MKTLQHKVVVITGAGSGIGRALAIQCAKNGATLALCDIDNASLAAVGSAVEQLGARVLTCQVDVSVAGEMQEFAAKVMERMGGADVIINNAGVALSESVENMRQEDFEWLFGINFWGTVHGCNAFLPQLRRRMDAHIVNVSSVFGLIGMPGQAAYSASKFAVRGFSESLRTELADSGVKVTVVHPGGIRTNIVRNGRHYTDVAGARTSTDDLAKHFDKAVRISSEQAALAIINAIIHQRPRLLIGAEAYAMDFLQRVIPAHAGRLAGAVVKSILAARRRRASSPATAEDGQKAGKGQAKLVG